jgi:hypothetical protein
MNIIKRILNQIRIFSLGEKEAIQPSINLTKSTLNKTPTKRTIGESSIDVLRGHSSKQLARDSKKKRKHFHKLGDVDRDNVLNKHRTKK